MKRWTVVLVLMVVFCLTLLSGAQAQEKKMVAKLADILSPDHPHTMTWMYFAEKVKEKTKGRLEIQVYHSGQLGQTKDLYLGMQMGNVEMAKLPVSFTGEWIPEVYVFDLPYLFNDREEMWRVFNSSVGKKFFNEIYPKQNLVGIMWADDGGRSIYTVNKAVRKPEDLKGLNFGGLEEFIKQIPDIKARKKVEFGVIGMLCYGAAFAPNPAAPRGFDMPVDLETGALREDVWARWLEWDPVRMIDRPEYIDAWRQMNYIYMDCGLWDDFNFQIGTRILSNKLTALNIAHDCEFFDDGHPNVQYRLDISLPRLEKVIRG